MPRTYSMSNNNVGEAGADRFKAEAHKNRIAMIPAIVVSTNLEIPEELTVKAQSGDKAAKEEIEYRKALKAEIEDGVKASPPQVVSMKDATLPDGTVVKRWMYPAIKGAQTAYIKSANKTYQIPDEIDVKTIKTVDVYFQWACLVVHYDTHGEKGDLIYLPPEKQEIVEGKPVTFQYSIKKFRFNNFQAKAWKNHVAFPPQFSDYYCWLEKKGNKDVMNFSPVGPALWMTHSATLTNKILSEAAEQFDTLDSELGMKTDVASLRTMLGLEQTAASSPATTAANFNNLVG